MSRSFLSVALVSLAASFFSFGESRAQNPFQGFNSDPRQSSRAARMEQWRSWRYGLFIHWGPYSKLGGTYGGKVYQGNTEWIMAAARIPNEDYRKVAADFDPKNYDPAAIVAFAKKAGFRYIILTAKHYDGFALFDSKASDFDAVDVLPSKRDLLKEFVKACEDAKMPLGFSYSINRDWYHVGMDADIRPWDNAPNESKVEYLEKVALPQVTELTRNYGDVPVMLFDHGKPPEPRIARKFIAAIGGGVVTPYDFTGRFTGDYSFTDASPYGMNDLRADWEQSNSLHDSWGYRNEPAVWQSAEFFIQQLVSTATEGGNYLLNMGLDGDGGIPPQARERLETIGRWLALHGNSIYGTKKSPLKGQPWKGGSTMRDDGKNGWKLYLHFFESPGDRLVLNGLISEPLGAKVMGTGAEVPVSGRPGMWALDLSGVNLGGMVPVVEISVASQPVTGPGPIVADGAGFYHLGLGRASLSGPETRLGRTPSSSNVRLTGFSNEAETATWQIYVDKPVPLALFLESIAVSGDPDKKLLLSINGKEIEAFGADAPPETGRKMSPRSKFTSKSFMLSAGANRISLSGGRAEHGSQVISVTKVSIHPR